MKNLLFLFSLIFILNSFASASTGSSGVGNGGDPVRDYFFLIGKNIIQNYSDGLLSINDELKKKGISDYRQLETALNIDTVHTSLAPLYDNKGSAVSALGKKGSITLYVGNDLPALSWNSLMLNKGKSERIVLHELLRAFEINDDNFVFTNIVLKNQGRIFNETYNFVWSKENDAIITSALSNSFNAENTNSELDSFRDSFLDLKDKNQLIYSELITVYIEFALALDSRQSKSNGNQKKLLSVFREVNRNLKNVNSVADKFASYATANNDQISSQYFLEYFILCLQQIPNTLFVFNKIDQEDLLHYIQSLRALATSDYSPILSQVLENSLSELEVLIKSKSSNEFILRNTMKTIKMLQALK